MARFVYVAKRLGFWGGVRRPIGSKIITDEEIKPLPKWLELTKEKVSDGALDASEVADKVKKAGGKKGQAVAEGYEKAVGIPNKAQSASDVEVI